MLVSASMIMSTKYYLRHINLNSLDKNKDDWAADIKITTTIIKLLFSKSDYKLFKYILL